MRLPFLICALCLAGGAFSQRSLEKGDPSILAGCSAKGVYPATPHAESNADATVDAIYYRLALKLDPSTQSLSGQVTMRARVVADSTVALMLDLAGPMSIDSVRTGAQRLSTTRFVQSFDVALPRAYRKGEIITLDMFYHGSPDPTGFGSFAFSYAADHPYVWSLSEPYGARDWWPCRDHPLDKADSVDVLVTCPDGLTVGSNGKRVSIVNNGDGTSTHVWSERYPIATYLVSIAAANYATFSNWYVYSPTDSMEVLNYILPDHLALALQTLPRTPAMLHTFSTLFGQYPFLKEKYGHSEFGWGGAMEHQTMTSTSHFDEDVISHELAHQWFGDLITCATWHDLWLNEGFATYSESLWREAQYGTAEYWQLITTRMASAKNGKGALYKTDTSSVANLFAVTGVYAKGASVLHMLRHVVGDSTFFHILKAYVADDRFRYRTASTEDFRSVCERVAGRPLGWFFNEWIYGESYPRYALQWSATPVHDSSYVTATINQIVLSTSPPFFHMPVDLRFSGNGIDTTITVFNSRAAETFAFVLPFTPTRADIDPDNWILCDILPANPLLPDAAGLDQNYPNPFNSGTSITMRLPTRMQAVVRIYDILGRRVVTLASGIAEPGSQMLRWEGKDDNGKTAPSGVYIVRLETESQSISRKILLVR